MAGECNILCLERGVEYYIFTYSDADLAYLSGVCDGLAANPDLAFDEVDAGIIKQQARDRAAERNKP